MTAKAPQAAGNSPMTPLLAQAVAQHRQGKLIDAKTIYEQVLASDDRSVIALTGLGTIHGNLGHPEECAQLLGKSLELSPEQPVALNNRGVALRDLKRYDEALANYDRALAIAPDYASAYINRSLVLRDLKRVGEALANCTRALAIDPNSALAYNNRGLALQDLARADEALASYDRALAINPRYAEAHNNRANTLSSLSRFDEALAGYDRAIAFKPDFAGAIFNRGIVLHNLNRLNEALECYDRALAIDPGYAMANWNKSVTLLRMGEYARGWALYDWRWKAGAVTIPPYISHITQRQWEGENLPGKLLVWGDQGLGDQLMFSVLAPELTRFTSQFTVAVEPRLLPLLRRSFPQMEIIGIDEIPGGHFEAQIALTHLGRFLRTKIEDFPPEGPPLLKVDAERSQTLREGLTQKSKLVCGLSWRSVNKETGRARSLRLQDLLPCLSLPHTIWIDLQYGDTRPERTALQAGTGLTVRRLDEVDNRNDIDGLAALINACDLIVTIDNTTVHLAAALGKPTWILLPFASDFRWLMDREDSPWYPTARLFRQARPDDWPSVIRRIRDELVRRVPQKND